MSILNKIDWDLRKPLSHARLVVNGERIRITSDIWNVKTNFKKGDKILILRNPTGKHLVGKVRGSTVKDILKTLEAGLNGIIKNNNIGNIIFVYNLISKFRHPDLRLTLAKKFESNKLKPLDLLGDYNALSGGFKKVKGVWRYSLSS